MLKQFVLARVRNDLKVMIEQPSSSWAFKLPCMRELIKQWQMCLGMSTQGAFVAFVFGCFWNLYEFLEPRQSGRR